MKNYIEELKLAAEAFERSYKSFNVEDNISDMYYVCLHSLKAINYKLNTSAVEGDSLSYWYSFIKNSNMMPVKLNLFMLNILTNLHRKIMVDEYIDTSTWHKSMSNLMKLARESLYCANEILQAYGEDTMLSVSLN